MLKKPEERKRIYLKGKAGIYKTGYSLKFKDDDYGIINPGRGNVLGKEFTIAFWFKSNVNNKTLLMSDNSKWTLSKFYLSIADSLLSLDILPPKTSGNAKKLNISSKSKVRFNEWNYAAIIHKNNITKLVLNDDIAELKTEEEHFNQIEDYFILGGDYHPLLIKDSNIKYRDDGWELFFAELKMYNLALNQEEIEKKKYLREDYSDKKLLAYYDFEEGLGHFTFDKTKNDMNLELFGQPQRTLDRPPLMTESKPIIESNNNQYVEVRKKGVVELNKNLFDKRSSFTIQMDAKAIGKEKEEIRSLMKVETMDISYKWEYINDDSISVKFSSLLQGFKTLAIVKRKIDNDWHRYTFDYSIESNKGRLFIDGELIADYDFKELIYDISRQNFCIFFGNNKNFDNPRYISEDAALDNIAIYNRTLSPDEIRSKNINKVDGLISLWTFSKVDGHVCYDEVNHYPVFIWDEFEVKEK